MLAPLSCLLAAVGVAHDRTLQPDGLQLRDLETHGFYASSAEASGLFTGCNYSVTKEELQQLPRLPGMILLGAQKAGTSSMGSAAGHPLFCHSTKPELHFFDRMSFAQKKIGAADLRGYLSLWEKKKEPCHADEPLFEKSPGYLSQAWTAVRLCEALHHPKLAVTLRDPVSRAYSSFYQAKLSRRDRINVTQTPEGFHALATLEIAIVKQCGGLFDGDPAVDAARAPTFAQCCAGVAAAHGQRDWAGCTCEIHSGGDNDSGGDNANSLWWRHSDYQCGYYGSKLADMVRNSIYVTQLRAYYRYHRPDDLLIFDMADTITNLDGVLKQMALSASSHQITPERTQLVRQQSIGPKHANGHHYGPMLNETKDMLTTFFAPYNDELFALIGRKLWLEQRELISG